MVTGKPNVPAKETAALQATADPSALGLFGLAMVTLVASSQKLGLTQGTANMLPWAIFLGAIAQLVAGMMDFKKNNVFGATAFSAYGLFWMAMALGWLLASPVNAAYQPVDAHQTGFAFLGYLVFSLAMTIAATRTNKVLLIIFALIDVLFLGLTLTNFGIAEAATHRIAACAELAIAVVSFYGCAANVMNHTFGYAFLPLGKPLNVFVRR